MQTQTQTPTQTQTQLQTPAQDWWLSGRALAAWWGIALLALLLGLGAPPVQRTQEARVLETAREMLGSGFHGWMVPQCDGVLRVRKPPLAYWMSAAAYRIGGVGEGAGRVPDALLGWWTLGLTFACGRWLFGRRAGFFAAACLLCSFLFFRFTRLAETDAPAMCFVTLGVYAFWRALGRTPARTKGDDATAPPTAPSALWFHLGAIGTALAILGKGPPGVYPALFLLVMVAVRRQWDALRRFVRCGAPLTVLILAAPWFAYVLHAVGVEQWKHESDELLGGEDHKGNFLLYFGQMFKATAPWFLLMPAALVDGIIHRRDARVGGVLVWLGVILVPLCVVANKQFHYLLPLMPPMMILIGWWLDRVLDRTGQTSRSVPLLNATFLVSALAIPGLLVGARIVGGKITPLDWALAAVIAAGLAVVARLYFTRGTTPAFLAYLAAVLVLIVPAVSYLAPRYDGYDSRAVARQIESQFGRGPYCFYGGNMSLPMCFNLRTVIPRELSPADLDRLAASEPDVTVIAQTKSGHPPPPIPPGFREIGRMRLQRQEMVFYRFTPQQP